MNQESTINIVKKNKSSGWFWIGISILILIILIPLLLYGILRAIFNGINWVFHHKERKLVRLEKKERKLVLKQNVSELKKNKKGVVKDE